MSDIATIRDAVTSLPLRALRVEVVDGPDAGKDASGHEDALTVGTAADNSLTLTDAMVSRFHAELRSTPEGVRVVDCGSTNGTWVGTTRIERGCVPAGAALRMGRTTLRIVDGQMVHLPLHARHELAGLLGSSASMRRLMADLERAARSDVGVLVTGESGCGKELVANALHSLGPRNSEAIVTVDCGALTPTLVASELFGHERGAFTGADARYIGSFERADGGVLFLDEVGELPLAIQANLLGVLERRRFRRLGGKDEISVDVRVVSATNRDLRADVNGGRFRLDLFHRLAIVKLEIPPLRERRDDIPLLLEHFVREAGGEDAMEALFPQATLDALSTHHWPGNVRELKNLVEATLAMGQPPPLLPSSTRGAAKAGEATAGDLIERMLEIDFSLGRGRVIQEFETRYLRRLLERASDNVSKAARIAGVHRSHLIALLHRYKIR
jgi:DNA-binding NtrC family response regulator